MMQRRGGSSTNASALGSGKPPAPGEASAMQHVLAVEHRCFFNELYRQNWDARNKLIKARHDKVKQGLVSEKALTTELE